MPTRVFGMATFGPNEGTSWASVTKGRITRS